MCTALSPADATDVRPIIAIVATQTTKRMDPTFHKEARTVLERTAVVRRRLLIRSDFLCHEVPEEWNNKPFTARFLVNLPDIRARMSGSIECPQPENSPQPPHSGFRFWSGPEPIALREAAICLGFGRRKRGNRRFDSLDWATSIRVTGGRPLQLTSQPCRHVVVDCCRIPILQAITHRRNIE